MSNGFVEPSLRKSHVGYSESQPALKKEEIEHIRMFDEMMQNTSVDLSLFQSLPIYLQENQMDEQRRGSIPLDFSQRFVQLPDAPIVPSSFLYTQADFEIFAESFSLELESFGLPLSFNQENSIYF